MLLWVVLVLMVSTGAAAGWTKASESAAGTGYVDSATIVRSGDNVTMWELTDYKTIPDRESIQIGEAAIRIRLQG